MELIDRRRPGLLVRRHLAAFPESNLPNWLSVDSSETGENKQADRPQPVFASRVLFNDTDEDIRIEDEVAEWLWSVNQLQGRFISDVPQPGTVCHPGEPVCTVFGYGQTKLSAIRSLNERATTVRNRVGSSGSSVSRILEALGPEFR